MASTRRQFVGGALATAAACKAGGNTGTGGTGGTIGGHAAGTGGVGTGGLGAGGTGGAGAGGVGAGGTSGASGTGGAAGTGGQVSSDASVQPIVDARPSDSAAAATGIIDSHTHFLYGGASSPAAFAAMVQPMGVTGTVVIEAGGSTDTLLALAADNRVIVAYCGAHSPGSAGFANQMRTYAMNKLFRGIRSGAWDSLSDLQLLASLDLTLDVNVEVNALPAVSDLAVRVPGLRIVINHIANYRYPGGTVAADFIAGMTKVAQHANVWCKVSSLRTLSNIQPAAWTPVLDELWRIFGEDRLMWASNWPVSADYAGELGVTRRYLAGKNAGLVDKFYAHNARAAYKFADRA